MNTIFSDFSKDVDLSIFKESKKDSKSSIRRHYLSLVGLLEYVDILNGDLPGRSLPDGMTAQFALLHQMQILTNLALHQL